MPASLYSEQMADDICEEIAMGRSLREICRNEPWAPAFRTCIGWLARDVGEFRAKCARARETQAFVHADDRIDIADTPQEGVVETDKLDKDGNEYTEVRRADMIEHRKLRISVRQWNAEKLLPKVYGLKQQIEHSGTLNVNVSELSDDDLVQRLLELQATGRFKPPGGAEIIEGETTDDDDIA